MGSLCAGVEGVNIALDLVVHQLHYRFSGPSAEGESIKRRERIRSWTPAFAGVTFVLPLDVSPLSGCYVSLDTARTSGRA